MYLLDP